MTVTPYAIVKHWSMLGELEQDKLVKELPMCDETKHLQIIKFDDGFSYCGRCKTEYPEKNAYKPTS